MSEKFDSIIVGAGVSGIICAGYLAKAGKKVLVLDKLSEVGGSMIPSKMMGCTISMIYPIVAKYKCGDASGWAKDAQDFGANVRMLGSCPPRIYLKGAEQPFMTIPICLSTEGAAKWMTELLTATRPDLMNDGIEQEMLPIMKEIYETPLEKMTVE